VTLIRGQASTHSQNQQDQVPSAKSDSMVGIYQHHRSRNDALLSRIEVGRTTRPPRIEMLGVSYNTNASNRVFKNEGFPTTDNGKSIASTIRSS
jgi:hypothetical protein